MSKLARALSLLLLCTVLLVPASAAAVSRTTLSFDADETAWSGYLETTGLTEQDAKRIGSGIRELGENFQLVFDGGQTEAGFLGEFKLIAKGDETISLKVCLDAERTLSIWTSVLPDYLLVSDELKQVAENFSQSQDIASEIEDVFDEETVRNLNSWLDGVPQEKQKGYFLGDAYDGATERTVLELNDRDLYLLWSLLRGPFEKTFAQIQTDLPDGFDLAAQIEEEICQAALANRYRYRLVSALRDGEFRGASFTASEGEKQLATVSIGTAAEAEADTVSAVIGVGVQNKVYYGAFSLNDMHSEQEFTLSFCEDKQRVGYRGAASEEENLILRLTGHFGDVLRAEQKIGEADPSYTFDLYAPGVEPLREVGYIWPGEDRLVWTDSLFRAASGERLMTVTAESAETEGEILWADGLKRLDINDLEKELENEEFMNMVQENLTKLGVKLFRSIPANLMVYLMQ